MTDGSPLSVIAKPTLGQGGRSAQVTSVFAGAVNSDVEDDRINIVAGDRVVLIVEDDNSFAKILRDNARENGFKAVVATSRDIGLLCAMEYKPDAIVLDINLPVMNGWTVLDRKKHDPTIRHIPVHIVSGDDVRQHSLMQGAISCLQKPLNDDSLKSIFSQIETFQKQKLKQLLVVEDNEKQRTAIISPIIREPIVFSRHNLVTDGFFNESNLIACRNVMIYFNEDLRDHVLQLLHNSLCRFGILILGAKENWRFTPLENLYKELDGPNRIYQRLD